jgi:hypothetical protein
MRQDHMIYFFRIEDPIRLAIVLGLMSLKPSEGRILLFPRKMSGLKQTIPIPGERRY